MKKMKKSLKCVLISLAVVAVLSVATVATVLLLRKPTPAPVVQEFTAQQQILINKLLESNQIKKNESTKTLEPVSVVTDEAGEAILQDGIHSFYDGYFVANDGESKILYVQAGNANVNVFASLKTAGKIRDDAQNLNAEKVAGKYLLYSFVFGQNDEKFKVYEIANFENLSDIKVENSIEFKLDGENLLFGETEIENLTFELCNGYFEMSYVMTDAAQPLAGEEVSKSLVKNVYLFGNAAAQQTYKFASADEIENKVQKSADENIIVSKMLDGSAKFSIKTEDAYGNSTFRTFNYPTQYGKEYAFYAVNGGVFVQEKTLTLSSSDPMAVLETDGNRYVYSYEYFDAKTMLVAEYDLSSGAVYAEFATDGEFLVVFEKTKDYKTVSDLGTICYYDAENEKIISYEATAITSTILHANNERFVTNDGIFACNKTVEARKVFDFATEEYHFEILSEVVSGDWFVVKDKIFGGSYILGLNGTAFGNELFVEVNDLGSGWFITTKNGKRNLVNPALNQKTLLKNYSNSYGVYLLQFGLYLIEDEESETFSLYGARGELIESGATLEVTARENYVSLNLTKNGNSTLYCLKQNSNFGENVFEFGNIESDEKLESEQPVEEFSEEQASCDACGEAFADETEEEEHVHNWTTSSYHDYHDGSYYYSPSYTTTESDYDTDYYTSTPSNHVSNTSGFLEDSDENLIYYDYPKTVTVTVGRYYGYTQREWDYESTPYTYEYTYRCSCGETKTAECDHYDWEDTGTEYISEDRGGETTYVFNISPSTNGKLTYSLASRTGPSVDYSFSIIYPTTGSVGNSISLGFQFSADFDFYDYIYDSNYSTPSISVSASTERGTSGFQPQEAIRYNLKFHNDTPYYYSTSSSHSCSSYEPTANQTCKTKNYIYYFDLSDEDYDVPDRGVSASSNLYSTVIPSLSMPECDHYLFRGWHESTSYTLDNTTQYMGYEDYVQDAISNFDGYGLGLGFSDSGRTINLYPYWSGVLLTMRFVVAKSGTKVNTSQTKIKSIDLHSTTRAIYDYDDIVFNSAAGVASSNFTMQKVTIFNPKPEELLSKVNEAALGINAVGCLVSDNFILTGWQICSEPSTWSTGNSMICSNSVPDDYEYYNRVSTSLEKIDDSTSYVYVLPSFTDRSYSFDAVETESTLSSYDSTNTLTLSGAANSVAYGYANEDTISVSAKRFQTKSSYAIVTINLQVSSDSGHSSDLTNANNYYAFDKVTIKGYRKDSKDDNYATDRDHVFQYNYFTETWSKIQFGEGENTSATSDANNIILVTASNAYSMTGSSSNYSNSVRLVLKVRLYGTDEDSYLYYQDTKLGTVEFSPFHPVYDMFHNVDYRVTENGDTVTSYIVHEYSVGGVVGHDFINVGAGNPKDDGEISDELMFEEYLDGNTTSKSFYAYKNNYKYSLSSYNSTAFANNSKMFTIEPAYETIASSSAVNNSISGAKTIMRTYLSSITVGSRVEVISNVLDMHTNDSDGNRYCDAYFWQDAGGNTRWYGPDDYVSFGTIQGYDIILGHKFNIAGSEGLRVFVGRQKQEGAAGPYGYLYRYFVFVDPEDLTTYSSGSISSRQTIVFSMTDVPDYGSIEKDSAGKNILEYNATTAKDFSYQNSYNSSIANLYIDGNNASGTFGGSNTSKVSDIAMKNFSYVKIIPETGFLIEQIVITVKPKYSLFTGNIVRTYSLDYEAYESSAVGAVQLSGDNFTSIAYKFVDQDASRNDLTIQNFLHLQFGVVGRSSGLDDDWGAPTDTESRSAGTVWLGINQLVDDVTISYKVVSYLDAMLKHFKYLDVNSYLQKGNSGVYQSDLNLADTPKTNSWFNDTTLSQIYLKSSSDDDLNIPSEGGAYDDPANYIYNTRTALDGSGSVSGSNYENLSFVYKKITGYLLNGEKSHFSIGLSAATAAKSQSFEELLGAAYNNLADTEVSLDIVRTSFIDALAGQNINKYALSANALTANYYADPVSYSLEYGKKYEETLYYDQEYRLDQISTHNSISKLQGYSFVGWVSQAATSEKIAALKTIKDTGSSFANSNDILKYDSDFGYLFTDEKALAALIGSTWEFGRTANGVATYMEDASLYSFSDFYIDGGWFISDSSTQAENYNFWCIGAGLDSKNVHFKDDGSGTYTLYPVWMANDYVLRFDMGDVKLEDQGVGSTETLFRINDTSYDYLTGYSSLLNNGFNFGLYYGTNDIYKRIRMEATENCTSTCEFYAYVRYDTSEWFFSDGDALRPVYFQDFFREDGQVNADRYGYAFVEWIVGPNKFDQPQRFDSDFYASCGSNVVDLNKALTFDYVGNPKQAPSSTSTNKISYVYGANGEAFDLESRTVGASYAENQNSDYEGTRVFHFVTSRLTNGLFRRVDIEAKWQVLEYKVRIIDNENGNGKYYAFADGFDYEILGLPFTTNHNTAGGYYESTGTYVFDTDEYGGSVAKICDLLVVKPYRRGYDFAGWTFAFNSRINNGDIQNDISPINKTYENYWYEQLYYEENKPNQRRYQGLCDDLLRYYNYYKKSLVYGTWEANTKVTEILHYTDALGNDVHEQLGDADNEKTHYVNLYANWTPMLYSIEIDLGLEEEYKDIASEVFAGLFAPNADGKTVLTNGVFDGGIVDAGSFSIDECGVASFNYMSDNKTYKTFISNVSFRFRYGMKLKEAYLTFDLYDPANGLGETVEYKISDLFVKINNHKFKGWDLFGFNDEGAYVEITSGDSHIDLEEKYFGNFAENSNEKSTYGYLTSGGTRYAILRDVVVEDFNEEQDPIVTERLYIEVGGKRYYLPGVDHGAYDTTSGYDFTDQYLIAIKDEDNYYLYNAPDGAYYVYNGSPAGNEIELFGDPKTNIANLTTTALGSLFNSNGAISSYKIVVENHKMFRLVADMIEFDPASKDYSLGVANNNNSNASFVVADSETYKVYYLETLDLATGIESKGMYVLSKDENNEYYYEKVTFKYLGEELLPAEDYLLIRQGTVTGESVAKNPHSNDYVKLLNDGGALYIEAVQPNGTTKKVSTQYVIIVDFEDQGTKYAFSPYSGLHHFTGLNEHSNEGLGGVYKVTTKNPDDVIAITQNSVYYDGTFNDNGAGAYVLETKFDYNTDAKIEILPYYNGRFLTEISFEFKHIFEDEIFRQAYGEYAKSKFDDAKLVFDLFFDSENRFIGIEGVRFVRGDTRETIWSIVRNDNLKGGTPQKDASGNVVACKFKQVLDNGKTISTNYGYLDWWRTASAIDKKQSKEYKKLLDFIDSYFKFMLPTSGTGFEEFITVAPYQEEVSDNSFARLDFNRVTLNIKQLKKEITFGMKFSVQTFDVNLYSVLNDDYNSQIDREGSGIDTPYVSKDALENDIDYTTSTISKDYLFDLEKEPDAEYPKFVTLINDSNESTQIIINQTKEDKENAPSIYNVPYGYFVYGYNLDSSNIGERPIDTEENKELIANLAYGFKFIYTLNYYSYRDTNLRVSAKNSDLINSTTLKETDQVPNYGGDNANLAQNAAMLGDPDKFLQSIRPDLKVLYYNFGGLFFIDEAASSGGTIKFRAVSEEDETSHLNKNYHIYAYYYTKTSASQTGFYAWNDTEAKYEKIEDIKDGYAYYSMDKVENFVMNDDGTFTKIGSGANTLMYTFKENGVDTQKFALDFVFGGGVIKEFENKDLEEEYIEYLKLVAQTYWFSTNTGKATLAVDISGVTYNEKTDMYVTAGGTPYALKTNRGTMNYGATLYKKSGTFYEKVTNLKAFNPSTHNVEDYAVINDYYVIYDNKYHKINYYSETFFGTTRYDPYKKHSIDKTTGVNSGNNVTISVNGKTKTYYFDYETKKLYEPNKIGVEVTDFNYEIMTPVNENYNISVGARTNGYGLYGITLNSIPDSSVGYWMPGTEFLFWAGITEEQFNSFIRYEADDTSSYGKIYTEIVNKFKLLDDYQNLANDEAKATVLKTFTDELNEKLKKYKFEDLICAGILINKFIYDEETRAVKEVELEFVVDLGEFASLAGFVADARLPINVCETFEILQAGSEVVSSLYAVQIYQKINFEMPSGSYVNVSTMPKTFFELYGDSVYYYTAENGDYVRLVSLSNTENARMVAASDKVTELNKILAEHKKAGVNKIVSLNSYFSIFYTEGENGEMIPHYTYYSYSGTNLWAFYYKANMPDGADPYVVAVAKKV